MTNEKNTNVDNAEQWAAETAKTTEKATGKAVRWEIERNRDGSARMINWL